MSIGNDADEAGSAPPTDDPSPMIQVWDARIRAFHWCLLGLFVIAYASSEEMDGLHRAAGYGIVTLLMLRILWGRNSPQQARFSDFVRSPGTVLGYLRQARQYRALRDLAHNPAGGAMAIALMAMLGGICLTGHPMTTMAFWGSETMQGLQSLFFNGTIGLIGLHLLGDLFSSRGHRENLTMSMITGNKRP